MKVNIEREKAIQKLDDFIDIAKRSSSNYKEWAYGFACALQSIGVIEFDELELLLLERGAW